MVSLPINAHFLKSLLWKIIPSLKYFIWAYILQQLCMNVYLDRLCIGKRQYQLESFIFNYISRSYRGILMFEKSKIRIFNWLLHSLVRSIKYFLFRNQRGCMKMNILLCLKRLIYSPHYFTQAWYLFCVKSRYVITLINQMNKHVQSIA